MFKLFLIFREKDIAENILNEWKNIKYSAIFKNWKTD